MNPKLTKKNAEIKRLMMSPQKIINLVIYTDFQKVTIVFSNIKHTSV
jgi:hypothetical protein